MTGRVMRISLLDTGGDVHSVGLTGLELLGEGGVVVPVCDAQIAVLPPDGTPRGSKFRHSEGPLHCQNGQKVFEDILSGMGDNSSLAPTLVVTQGPILSQSPTGVTRFWWHFYGS